MSQTIYTRFHETVEKYSDEVAVAVKKGRHYIVTSYRYLDDTITQVADGLTKFVNKGDTVALMLDNGSDWVTADLACASIGAVVVPIHTTYNSHYVEYILKHAQVRVLMICKEYYKKHIDTIQSLNLHQIIIVDEGVEGKNVVQLSSLINTTTPKKHNSSDINHNALHTIVYTSGTTGNPKGVELTHKNLLSNVDAVVKHISIHHTDRFFSFLPLSHIFERTAGYYVPLLHGASVYFSRSTKTLAEDIKEVKPTILISVPRIFERFHEKVISKFSSSGVLHTLFKYGMNAADSKRKGSGGFMQSIGLKLIDMIIFSKIRGSLGGRLRFAISGGAALYKHIAEFFESVGILILEGYGLTETSPVLTVNKLDSYKLGTVGTAIESVELKIAQNGEILARGEGIMRGYHNSTTQTDDVLDKEGWFHTGDMGSIDEDGYLSVIGRLKEIIVLSTGKNIFPVPIEQALEESKYIQQAMVYGDGQRHISALIVPDFFQLDKWCKMNDLVHKDRDLVNDKKVLDFYRVEIKRATIRMQSFEQVKDIKLLVEQFSQDNNLLTPTLKLKRLNIIKYFVHTK